MSASCSMEPESRSSDRPGRWSLVRSVGRRSWDKAITGTFSSLAITFRFRVISEISLTRLSVRLVPVISCR